MEDPAFSENPFRGLEEARKKQPWLATCKFGLVVHQYAAIRELYIQGDKLRPPYEASSSNWDFRARHAERNWCQVCKIA
jgi:hypothetical protein